MADTSLVFNIFARDKTGPAFKEVGSKAKALYAVAGAGAVAFATVSIQKFAAVQDATSALQATYGDTADAFLAFANDSADAFNLSKREALDAATQFANFGRAAGLSGKQLEKFTTPLIERAADAASYFGGSTSDAIEAFGAALRGEMEPIRKYGVLLDDATLRSKALEMGLISTTKQALTPQQKALAAQNLILEKTAQAQGDVARTSDSMANQIKDAQQQIDDFQVSVGETLAVAVGPLLQKLNGAIDAFNGLPQPVKSAAVALGILGTAAVVVVPKVLALHKAMMTAGTAASQKFETGMKRGAKGVGILGAALAASALVNSFSQATVDAAENADQLGKALKRAASDGVEALGPAFHSSTGRAVDFNEALGLVRDNHWWDNLETGLAGVLGTTSNLGMARDAVKALDDSLANMVGNGSADAAADAIKALGINGDEAAQIFPGYAQAIKNAAEEADAAEGPTKDLTAAVDDQKKKVQDLNTAWKKFDDRLSNQDAKDAATQAIYDLSDSLKTNGKAFDDTSKKGLANRDALRRAMQAVKDHVEALDRGPAKAKAYQDGLNKLKGQLEKSGLTPAQRNALLQPLIDVGKQIDTVKSKGAASIALKITPKITGQGKVVLSGAGGKSQFFNVDYMERGGRVKANQPYIVGEKRPELFVPDTAGRIIPQVPSGTGSGLTINGDINVMSAPGERAEQSVPRALRRTAFVLGMGVA